MILFHLQTLGFTFPDFFDNTASLNIGDNYHPPDVDPLFRTP